MNKLTEYIVKNISEKKKINYEFFKEIALSRTPRYKPVTTKFLGKKFEAVDAVSFVSGKREIYDRDIYRFHTDAKSPVIIDCGANIGLSVIYFKRLYPNAIIEAFEPDPSIYQTLSNNVSTFGFDDIQVHQKAIWITDEGIEFQQEGGFSGRIPKEGDTQNIIKVPTTRLKNLLQKYDAINFLKIDIEGAEYVVLKDCGEELLKVEHIFIEYHSHVSEQQTLHEILALMTKQGFRYHIQEAFIRERPYVDDNTMLGMDLQLNIYGYRE